MGLREEKLEPRLRTMLADPNVAESLPVIVQTFQGVTPQVMDLLKMFKGSYKEDLKIIKGFTADLSPRAIEALILSDLIKAISYDAQVSGFGS
ncbi:hypothetical protein JST97_27610 [bacterium]|nr:hypothetical protein [bacterium]